MLLTTTLMTKWVGKYKKYYVEKGYTFTKMLDTFEVKVEDLLENSNEYVEVLCDYCKLNISRKTYQGYNFARKIIDKDCCDECKYIKTKESNLKIYGVESTNSLEEQKIKIGNKNRKYNNDDVMFELNKKDYSLYGDYTYKTVSDKIPYVCNKHKEIGVQYTTLTELRENNNCCDKCIRKESSIRQRKYTPEELNDVFNNINCELIISNYENQNSSLSFICNLHREKGIQVTTTALLENNTHICFYCRDKISTCLPIIFVKEKFLENHLILLNPEYGGEESQLNYICEYHTELGEQICTYQQFKYNKNVCKGCIAEDKEKVRIKEQTEFFDLMISEGLIPTNNAWYKDSRSKIEYTCVKHPNIIQKISKVKFSIDRRCRKCGIDKNSGKTHYNYQGGISALNNHLRGLLRPLVYIKLQEFDFKCFITGKNGTLEVHHLYNFNKIVKDILKELNLAVKDKVEGYSFDEINKINKLFIEKHKNNWGVPILPELHDNFHKIYGNKNNTIEQFEEFIITL